MKRFLSIIITISIILSFSISSVGFSEEIEIFSDSFESGLGNWSVSGGETSIEGRIAKISEDRASHGQKSLYVYDESASLYAGVNGKDRIYLDSLHKYTISTDVYVLSEKIRLDVRAYDSAGTQLSVKRLESSTRNQWETLSITIPAVSGVSYIKVYVQTSSKLPAEGYIDNVKIIDLGEIPSEELSGYELYEELRAQIAEAEPGDVIEIDDGTYWNIQVSFVALGTSSNPITIKAKNAGKVVFKGNSSITMEGSYLALDGLRFENCTSEPDIILIKDGSSNCVINNVTILNCNPENLTNSQRWIGINGQYHKISNCYFRGKEASGMMVEVARHDSSPNYIIVENCYFGDYKNGTGNGFETLRIGTSSEYSSGSYSIVRNCFFEECNGETEIVSIKSSNNKIYNNTFYNCDGAVYSRHGNNNEFVGNLFIGGAPTTRDTGIVIYGDNHKVSNNYFYNLPRTSNAVVLKDGNPNPEHSALLQPVTNIDLSNNTVVGCDFGFEIGEYSPSANVSVTSTVPPEGTVENNVLISYKGVMPQIFNGDSNSEITYLNNYVLGKSVGYDGSIPDGIIYGDRSYTLSDGFLEFAGGIGADLREVKKAPENPFEIISDDVKEDLYDTNTIKFRPVYGDFLNTSFNAQNLFPSGDEINVILNGIRIAFEKDPYIKNGDIMVPASEFFEIAEGTYSASGNYASASRNGVSIRFYKDSSTVTVEGKTVDAGITVDYIDGEFFIPLGFTVKELYGYYDLLNEESTGIVTLNEIYSTEDNEQFFPVDENGTEESPYLINNYYDFIKVFGKNGNTDLLNSYFKQTCDIVFPTDYEPLDQSDANVFTGVYDGNGYSVELSMSDVQKSGNTYGGLFTKNYGTIKNLTVKGTVNFPNGDYNGGIAGINYGIIDNCVNEADVTGLKYTGGIAGGLNGQILYSANYGEIVSEDSFAGGIGGVNEDDVIISKTFNAGTVISESIAGGILGSNNLSLSGKDTVITDCYNTGVVDCSLNSGSLIGNTGENAEVTVNRFYDISNPELDIIGDNENTLACDVQNAYILNSQIESEFASSVTPSQLNSLPSGFPSSVWGIIAGAYPYIQFTETDENGEYINKFEGDINSGEYIYFDDVTNVKRADNLLGEGYNSLVVTAAKYNKSENISEDDIEYGVIASKDTPSDNLTVEEGTKFAGDSVNDGLFAVTLLNTPDTLSVRPYALYNDVYYYGNAEPANRSNLDNAVETPILTYVNDYVNNRITVSWTVDSNAEYYSAEVYADGVKLTNGYDESDINNGNLYITNSSPENHYSSVYNIFITAKGNGSSSSDSEVAEIEIDNTIITGTGIQGDPYVIRSGEQFKNALGKGASAENMTKHYIQSGSFTLLDYTPMTNGIFSGVYDGNGEKITISGYVAETSKNGLVETLGRGGVIKNLTVAGELNASQKTNVGAIAGYLNNGTIINCVNEAYVYGRLAVGGIVGLLQNGTIKTSVNKGNVTGVATNVGGIAGYTNGTALKTIFNCANYGKITGGSSTYLSNSVGGIVGAAGGNLLIENSFNSGCIESKNGSSGAIAGTNYQNTSTQLSISNCFNTGVLEGTSEDSHIIIGTYTTPNEGETFSVSVENFYDILNPELEALPSELSQSQNITGVYILGVNDVTAQTIIDAYEENTVYNFQINDGYDFPDFALTADVTVSYDYETGGAFSFGNTENGTQFYPWIIDSAEEFISLFGQNANGRKLTNHFKQTVDITLPASYRAYGQGVSHNASVYKYFSGVYDGNGHTINISMTDNEQSGVTYAGIFSANKGTIKNLKVTGFINIPNGTYIGGIAGANYGKIENCTNDADITARGTVGGITGKQENSNLTGILSGCLNTGNITSSSGEVGGIIGSVNCRIIITRCANYGNITNVNRAGGIIGGALTKVVISECFNAGEITSSSKPAGAIIGNTGTNKNTSIEIYDCYNVGEINGYSFASGLAIGTFNSDTQNGGYTLTVKNVYDASGTATRVVSAGEEYLLENTYILGRKGVTKEDIISYFGNKDGWVILEGFEYPQLINNSYDE